MLFVYLGMNASCTSHEGCTPKKMCSPTQKNDPTRNICVVLNFSYFPLSFHNLFLSLTLSLQYHPLSLCNTSEDEQQESDFIIIVKLEHRVPRCLPLLDKVHTDMALSASCFSPS